MIESRAQKFRFTNGSTNSQLRIRQNQDQASEGMKSSDNSRKDMILALEHDCKQFYKDIYPLCDVWESIISKLAIIF